MFGVSRLAPTELGSAEWMLMVQAFSMVLVCVMAAASGHLQRKLAAVIRLAAEMRATLAAVIRLAAEMRATLQAVSLPLCVVFVFLLQLGICYVTYVQAGQLKTCRATHATLSQDKQALERELKDALALRDTCRESVKEKQKQHDSALATSDKEKKKLERGSKDALALRDTCRERLKEKQKQHDNALALRDTCGESVKEKQKQHDSALAASDKEKQKLERKLKDACNLRSSACF